MHKSGLCEKVCKIYDSKYCHSGETFSLNPPGYAPGGVNENFTPLRYVGKFRVIMAGGPLAEILDPLSRSSYVILFSSTGIEFVYMYTMGNCLRL